MSRTIVAAVLVSLASPAVAQLAGPFTFPAGQLDGYEVVGRITLTPATLGDEILLRHLEQRDLLTVAASRDGAVCTEQKQSLPILSDPRASIVIADVTGDGIDDVVAIAGNAIQVMVGIGLDVCASKR